MIESPPGHRASTFPAPVFALTGGIASGKSTVSRRLAELGAVIVDSDVIARQVVEPGQPALEELRAAFGDAIITPAGSLDRAALGSLVFSDDAARARLNGILHPAIRRESERQVVEAQRSVERQRGGAGVVVQDIPLLVETGRAAEFALVATVEADTETRVERMVKDRGMAREDAVARIAAQASEEERRAIADVVVANDGTLEELFAQVDALFDRMSRFSANVRAGQPAPRSADPVMNGPSRHDWTSVAERLCGRIALACGDRMVCVEHIGSTSVSGFPAKDVVDVHIEVEPQESISALRAPLASAGFVQCLDATKDVLNGTVGEGGRRNAIFLNADPGCAVNLYLKES